MKIYETYQDAENDLKNIGIECDKFGFILLTEKQYEEVNNKRSEHPAYSAIEYLMDEWDYDATIINPKK